MLRLSNEPQFLSKCRKPSFPVNLQKSMSAPLKDSKPYFDPGVSNSCRKEELYL